MKPISDFYTRVIPRAPGCPEPTAAQAIVDAAVEFCERSTALRKSADPVTVLPTVNTYALTFANAQALTVITKVYLNGKWLHPVAKEMVGVPQANDIQGEPTHYWESGGSIVLFPTPPATGGGTLLVEAAVRPAYDATELEDVLYDRWVEAIVAGALMKLHLIGGQPFTDMKRAEIMAGSFAVQINRARLEALHGQAQGSLRVTARPFA